MLGYIILCINTFVISFYYNNYQISYLKKSTRKKKNYITLVVRYYEYPTKNLTQLTVEYKHVYHINYNLAST